MSDEQAAMERAGRYWDAVVLGDGAAGLPLDPALARTIHRLHGLAATPSDEARDRVWQAVLANAAAARRQEEGSLLGVLAPNGRALEATSIGAAGAQTHGRQRSFLTQLATAALILLSLVGSYMVFGPGRVSRQEAPPVFIPAIEATPATPETDEAPVVEFLWSSEGAPDMPFGDPYFLTLGPDGNLWIPDGNNGRIQIFSPDGEFIESWGTAGDGEGEFNFTDGAGFGALAFDDDGSIYVADMGNDRVQKFGPDRTFLMSWGGVGDGDGQFQGPLGIAVAGDGRVYVTDVKRHDVQVFDREGNFLAKWGELGSQPGELSSPHAIAFDADGDVWIANFDNNRLEQFSPDGAFLQSWNGADSGGNRFNNPANIVFDAQGRMYVSEWQGHRVQILAPNGDHVATLGVAGIDEGEFLGPLGIAVDGTGRVFVTEDGNDRVQAFRLLPPLGSGEIPAAATPEAEEPIAEFLWAAEGSPELEFREPNHPVIGPDGNIWMPDGWNNRIAIFGPDGTWLEDWGTEGSGDGEFLFENGGIGFGGVAFDGDGNIYVADSGNHRVQKFGPDRAFLSAWGGVGDGDGQFRQPVALAVDGQGRVYVSDRWGSIEVFDGDGGWLASWDGLGSPVGITVDLDGNVWVADEGQTEVIKFAPDGERLLTWDAFGFDAGAFSQPSGVDVDAEGRLFVSDRNNRVQIFSPDGDYLGSWGSFGLEPGKINGPYGIAVGENGVAYTGEDFGRRLQAFRLLPPFGPAAPIAESTAAPVAAATPAAGSSAIAEVVWETRGGPGLPLSNPGYLALDPEGNLWIPDSGNDRFQIFAPDGRFLEAWGETGGGDGEFEFEADLFHSSSVAFAPDGSFYVADSGNFRVQKFGSDRAFVTAWGEHGIGPGQFDLMNGIAVDGQGRVFVTDDGRGDVQVFDADGAHLMTIGERGFNDGQFLFSAGSAVAVDDAGTLWVSDSTNQRIQTFSPDGEFLSLLAGGPRENELQQPNQLAIDGEGRIFVASPQLRQVQIFAGDGTYLGAIGTANPAAWAEGAIPSGEFLAPTGVALDGEGNIYVADSEDYRVQKFRLAPLTPTAQAAALSAATTEATPTANDSLVEFVWETSGGPGTPFDDPTALAVAPDGNVWVPDGSNGRFQIFTPEGEFVETWGRPGSGEGEFDFGLGGYGYGAIAWDADGNLYVADSGNFRIQKFAPDRSFLLAWGGRGDEDGQFQEVTNLAIDGENRIYAIDSERHVIQIFDQEGNFLDAWGNQGIGDGEFLNPGGAAFDADGTLYVSEYLNFRVQTLAPDGSSLGSWGSNGTGDGAIVNPTDVAIDGQGRVFVAGWGNHRVQMFTTDGAFLGAWGELGFEAGQFVNPQHLAIDSEGFVYVSDEGSDRVQKFRLLSPATP